ncbi:MAG: CvpA family protein [Oscillospiraceae bacterium]|nr:CvpA family protein [Oscillospiraceae bacterium]
MALATIINLILVVIIVVCAWQGFKKGIIMGIVGVLVIILSLYGGQLLSDTFSYEVIPVLKPFISGYMENQVENTTYELLGYEMDENENYVVDYSLSDLLEQNPGIEETVAVQTYKSLGFYDAIAEDLGARAVEYMDENDATISSSVITILCQAVTWYGGFLLFFIIIYALLTVLVNIPNLSFRLPYVGIVNDVVGLGIGIFTGLLLCAIIVWALQFAGLLIPEETLRTAKVASYLLDKNMLSNYITF